MDTYYFLCTKFLLPPNFTLQIFVSLDNGCQNGCVSYCMTNNLSTRDYFGFPYILCFARIFLKIHLLLHSCLKTLEFLRWFLDFVAKGIF